MPEGAVNQCSDYLEVQAKFGVSEHAAQIRYSQCALQRARQSPPEVLDFLRISSGRSPQTASGQASVRRERLETTVEACWRNAALIPGKDPSIVRCCCRGYEVLRSDYLKERSPKGWCIRDNRVVSYRALRLTGLGDKFASAFEDSPCPACGTFSVERRNGRRVCVECNKIQ